MFRRTIPGPGPRPRGTWSFLDVLPLPLVGLPVVYSRTTPHGMRLTVVGLSVLKAYLKKKKRQTAKHPEPTQSLGQGRGASRRGSVWIPWSMGAGRHTGRCPRPTLSSPAPVGRATWRWQVFLGSTGRASGVSQVSNTGTGGLRALPAGAHSCQSDEHPGRQHGASHSG